MRSAKFIQLKAISPNGHTATACGQGGGSGCKPKAGPGDMPPEVWEKIKNHPCYSEAAHHHFARMHVAVAPACNIQCNYCNRKFDCSNESRPGVVSEKLTPDQALKKVLAVATAIPQLSVVGIAGPGDALANAEKTFRTFELVSQAAPDVKLCLSTNGLLLPEHVDCITALKIEHVTITINMVDPEVGQHIYPWIFYQNRRWTGIEASRILHAQQMKGLEMLAERGVLCKVNSVMIPGINDRHLVEVNREVKARGAFLHNIMPLISAPEHGTEFGLRGLRGPSAQELKALQDECEGELSVMRHCRQCRADAVGMLGEDRSAEFTAEKIEAMTTPAHDAEAREKYRRIVERQRREKAEQAAAGMAELAAKDQGIAVLVAVASKGDGKVSQHFGHASEFQVYEVSAVGANFVGHRRVDLYCQGGYAEEDALPMTIRALNDCHAVLVAKIGACPRDTLTQAGIDPVERHAFEYIEPAALAWFKGYLEKVATGEIEHVRRGDAQIRQGAYVSAA